VNEVGAGDGWAHAGVPTARAEPARRLARSILREPFQKRTWAELGYFLASSTLACVAALALGALGMAALMLTVVVVGVPILAVGLLAARDLGRWQRALARWALDEDISEPEPLSARTGLFGWLRASLGDRTAWRAVVYFVAKVPLSFFGAWFALGIWSLAVLGIISPLTGHAGSAKWAAHLGLFGGGLALLFVAPWTMRLVVYLDRRMMRVLLGPDAAASRVRSLEESRSKTLDAATQTLQRIERNLHDGTQAQLVALAMRLGQAKDKLGKIRVEADETADLDAIRRLVDDAHRGAKEAITDLRDLARGIHPPALDTGLENALATLAARSPVPTEVSVSVRSRPSPAIEAICYFCAAELLANVAQHAHASRASLSCAQHGPWLRVVVRDNGRGGAIVNTVGSPSSGLAGLADRVGAVDGHLSIASPLGGPTAVTVDLPIRA
jgi:signal transduction histidine kinase